MNFVRVKSITRRICTLGMCGVLFCIVLLPLKAAARQQHAAVQKYILDTDIGDDIDDAYALVLLAGMPEVKLLGVTTTFGQTRERAEIAAKLLTVLGHSEIPVYAGRRGPSAIRQQYEWARGYAGRNLKTEEAVLFLKREIDRAPGEITLIGIGALTNYGDLLTRYPETRTKIRRIVIMGGSAYSGNNQPPPSAEWNIRCDPAAARVVYSSGVPLTMAGLEVTQMMQFDGDHQKRLYAYGTPGTDALSALTYLWGGSTPTLFDVVAVAHATGHFFTDSEQRHIEVDENGVTRITDGAPNVTVLVHPKKEEFLNWYVKALDPRGRRD